MLLVVKIASLKHRPSGAHLLPFLWISLSRILFSIPMCFVLLVLLVTRGVEFHQQLSAELQRRQRSSSNHIA